MTTLELRTTVKSILEEQFEEKVTVRKANEITESIFKAIEESLVKDGEVVLPGIGKIKSVQFKARTCVNPQKPGETIQIPETKRLRIKPTKSIKERINS